MYNGNGTTGGYAKAVQSRQSLRSMDIMESEKLLLELSSYEPTIQHCFKVIEDTCLSQGIFCKIEGKPVSDDFLEHIEEFYTPFCRHAIRAMCTYGFVPWHVRRLKSGDLVPEVLPPGTFTWFTDVNRNVTEAGRSEVGGHSTSVKHKYAHMHEHETCMVIYRVKPTSGTFKEENIHVYMFKVPDLDVMPNSVMYSTVISPMAHLLTDYKALRQGQIRRSHADAWNTTAKVITEFDPKLRVEDNPTQYLMDFVHEDYYVPPSGGKNMYPPFEAHNVWQREQVIRRQFNTNPSTHYPEVFALPRDHRLTQQTRLDPCEDIVFLYEKFRKDACSILGVPWEMISGGGGKSNQNESKKKTMASGRLFSTSMQDYCKHLQRLLKHVYSVIYLKPEANGVEKKGIVSFTLVPMPRLEVESIADLQVLHEIGALTPDVAISMSRMLLGDSHMHKKRNAASMGGTLEQPNKKNKNDFDPRENESDKDGSNNRKQKEASKDPQVTSI